MCEGWSETIEELGSQIEDAFETAERNRLPISHFKLRLTPLDPARPAPDLLETLIAGIAGCRNMYLSARLGETGADHPAGLSLQFAHELAQKAAQLADD